MTYSEFQRCIDQNSLPDNCSVLLKALYHDAKGDWESAHDIAQSREGTLFYDRLHAYLHRKEGDEWNANYWYRRAKSVMPSLSLQQEWEQLVHLFLDNQ